MKLSIIIPTLNEAENVRQLLPCLHEVMAQIICDEDYEILIVDANSKDDIERVAEIYKAKLMRMLKGYGVAIAEGIKASKGDYIITMDADFSHSPYIIPILYSSREEADMLIASRYVKNGFNNAQFFRRLLSLLLNTVYRFVLDLPVRDMSSGFRLYRRRIFDEVTPTEKNYVVLQEILMKAHAQGFRIKEVPFHYDPRKHGSSKSRLIKFGKEYLFSLYKFWRLRNSIDCADYDERAFHSRIWLQRYWQRQRYHIICDFSREYKSILDIGCGSSQILEGLPQSIGCDIQSNKLRHKRSPYRQLIQANVFSLPFKDNTFEATIFSQVIEHLPEDPQVLNEVVRVTKKNGFMILGTPDYATHWRIIEKIYKFVNPSGYADEHITHYTRESLKEEMRKRGCLYCGHRYILGAELIIKFQKVRD